MQFLIGFALGFFLGGVLGATAVAIVVASTRSPGGSARETTGEPPASKHE